MESVEGEPDAGGGELKQVLEVTGRLPEPLLDLAVWIAEGTASTLARAVALVVPPRPPKRRLKPVEDPVSEDRPVTLTDAQQAAVEAIERARADGAHEVLLHGVTGSGKTEVYLRAIERELADGRGAIVLVPEIALTPQTAARFQARFGDTVAVLHSALTPARRGAEHRRIADGEARVVVGARSAVFAAMPRAGHDRGGRGARRLLQARERSPIRRPPRGREAGPAGGRAGRVRQRHAAAGILARHPAADRATRARGRPAAGGARWSICGTTAATR